MAPSALALAASTRTIISLLSIARHRAWWLKLYLSVYLSIIAAVRCMVGAFASTSHLSAPAVVRMVGIAA